MIMIIPLHIEYIDCPDCVGGRVTPLDKGRYGNLGCKTCDGESVIRKDGKAILKTKG